MQRLFPILIVTAFLLTSNVYSRTVIFGTSPQYKHQKITVFGYSDYVSGNLIPLSETVANSEGYFKLEIDNREIMLVKVPLGIYIGSLYIDTSSNYEIILPDYRPISTAEKLNPYFEPSELFIGVKNIQPNDINLYIQDFESTYNQVVGVNYAALFKSPKKHFTDSIINLLESNYDTIPGDFFRNYRYYKYAWINFISVMRESRYVVKEYFQNKPILYQNPAYMDLFNQLFENYFQFYGQTKEGERLYSDIALAKSPRYIKQTLANNLVVTENSFQELVILKGLHDAFNTKDYPINSLLITLDSVASLTKIAEHKEMAYQIRNKVLLARQGFKAPAFELRDAGGVFRTNKEYLANYVYLNFFSVESYACQSDLALLKGLYEKHKADFRVISICVDDDFQKAITYFKENGYDWTLLSYKDQPSITVDYKVKAYPSYYLIEPNGKLVMSPAAGPNENFEWRFFKYIQATKRN